MGRMKERPRYNVISMRVSDEERRHLESLVRNTRKSVSKLMREAMVEQIEGAECVSLKDAVNGLVWCRLSPSKISYR